ncbi:MAG TPA: efflux RND transporter periplasmic adaptor subunit [Thermohalobaculum sp.]|nr:efflux RND transporter periplasmic adaptor subunit [Thermohalobaculum sp.]
MRFTSLILALLLGGGVYYWFAVRPLQGDQAGPPGTAAVAVAPQAETPEAVPVMVLLSKSESTATRLTLRGRTAANRNVSVPAETAGLVISQPLRKGATVAEGDVLCRLDPGARQAQLLEAEARLAEARVEAEAATTLSQKGFASETTRMSRQAQLEAAQAAVDLVRLDIARLVIRAPFSGVLETDTAEIGSRLGPGDTCATLIDLSSVKVTGFVSEQEVDQIELGQTAAARLINGRVIPGEISFISRVSDPETRTFQVEVKLPNPDDRIRDGMTAELQIELPARVANRIPQTALTLDDDGRLGVRLAEDGVARFYPVRIVREEVDGVWVSGLPGTAEVIVVGQEFVRDGRAVAANRFDGSALQ